MAAALVVVGSYGSVLYVDTSGSDRSGVGSKTNPFRTISHCHEKAVAGDVCEVGDGVYREEVTVSKGGVAFRGAQNSNGGSGGAVVVSGLEPLDLSWSPTGHKCIYSSPISAAVAPLTQLFYGGAMMVEARWPNVDIGNVGDSSMQRRAWRVVGKDSAYGRIVDPGLRSNFSWDGALATLNVGHQWNTWTRVVSKHNPVDGTFEYPKDLPGLAGFDPTKYPHAAVNWDGCHVTSGGKCNQYWLSGKLEALDAPGEWFHELGSGEGAPGTLYFYPPECAAPTEALEYKARDYAFHAPHALSSLRLEALTLRGATLNLANCTACELSRLTLRYPTYDREVRELNKVTGHVATSYVAGQHIALTDLVLTQSNNGGLTIDGYNVSLDNCLISFTDWLGSLTYHPLGVRGNQMRVARCTVHDFGNAGVVTSIPNVRPAAPGQPQLPPLPMAERLLAVGYSHIYNGARVGEDTAALYSGGWNAAGTVWHHNWVHDTTEKCLRFDDQSMNTSIHHNVIYNCGMPHYDPSAGHVSGLGLVAKGDGHVIYANTIFNTNYSELCLSDCVEKLKPFRRQYPRILQNAHSQIFNVAARNATGRCECPTHDPPGGNLTAIYRGTTADLRLANVARMDFRPTAVSPLVDAGAIVPPYTDGYVGRAPDIGAYERGGDWWKAGCEGLGEACTAG